MINKLLLWEKYRPKELNDMILLPRIRKHFESGINSNYIFHGNFGTGKTSLSRILVGKYSKDKPFLEINSSLYRSIELLRNEIDDFCKVRSMLHGDYDYKYILLDEFEKTSSDFQDAFKAFIEKYNRHVRFIITTNHIDKIDGGIKSRIPQLNFDCQNLEEERYLKIEMYKRIKDFILPGENFNIEKDDLISIINKSFPDFRSTLQNVQLFIETGNTDDKSNISNKEKLELYNFIYDNTKTYEDVYHYLMDTFGGDNISGLIKLLGKPFIDWSISENKNIDKLFECNFIIADYSNLLTTSTDPIILGMTIIGKFRKILL